MKNKHRPAKSEIRRQARAAARFARQNGGRVDPHIWRTMAPKAAR